MGSRAFTPYNAAFEETAGDERPDQSGGQPHRDGRETVAQQQPHDVRPARPDGDAEADLARPLARDERGDAIDADGREGQRERRDISRDRGERPRKSSSL